MYTSCFTYFHLIKNTKTAFQKKKQTGPSKKSITSPQFSITILSQATPQKQAAPIKSQAIEKTQGHETTKDKGHFRHIAMTFKRRKGCDLKQVQPINENITYWTLKQ